MGPGLPNLVTVKSQVTFPKLPHTRSLRYEYRRSMPEDIVYLSTITSNGSELRSCYVIFTCLSDCSQSMILVSDDVRVAGPCSSILKV